MRKRARKDLNRFIRRLILPYKRAKGTRASTITKERLRRRLSLVSIFTLIYKIL